MRRRNCRLRKCHRRIVCWCAGRHFYLGSWHLPEKRSHKLGCYRRTSACNNRRTARRTIHRTAYEERTNRPFAGFIRQKRRVAHAGYRRNKPYRLFRFGLHGSQNCAGIPHTRDTSHRWISRKRVGCMAIARHKQATRHPSALRNRRNARQLHPLSPR